MKYHFRFYPPRPSHQRGDSDREDPSTDFGYVHCVELFGCSASLPDAVVDRPKLARSAARRALARYLEILPIETLTPTPLEISIDELNKHFLFGAREVFAVAAPPAAALAIKLRRLRAQRLLMQSDAARRLGWPSLYSYQRLEDPRKCNPTLSTLHQLKQVFPELDIADLFET